MADSPTLSCDETPRTAPRVLAAIVLPALIACLLAIARQSRVVFTSDSTAQQSIVRTWLDVGHGTTHLPADTWLFKFPLYLLVEPLGLAPTTRLLIEVLVLTAVTFALLGAGVMLLAPRARWYELAAPLAFLAALGGGIGSNRSLSNYRNVELGLCFLLLALAARYLAGHPLKRPRLTAGLTVLGLTAFWFDDPYFEMLVGAPLMVLALAWFLLRVRNRRLLWLAACLFASFVLLPVVQTAVGLFGLEIDHTKQLSPSLDTATSGLGKLASDTAIQFGVEHWRDASALVLAANGLTLLAYAALLAGSAVGTLRFWRSRRLVPFLIAASWPLSFLGTLVQDEHPTRYLILAPYLVVVNAVLLLPGAQREGAGRPWTEPPAKQPGVQTKAAPPAPGRTSTEPPGPGRPRGERSTRVLVSVLCSTALVSGISNATSAIQTADRPSVALTEQAELIDTVKSIDVQKGYAPYWYGNITSYLAEGDRTVYELSCRKSEILTRSWLSDTARLTRPASRTFFIWVPDFYEPRGCTAERRDQLLGAPAEVHTLSTGVQVLVYDHDIGTGLPAGG